MKRPDSMREEKEEYRPELLAMMDCDKPTSDTPETLRRIAIEVDRLRSVFVDIHGLALQRSWLKLFRKRPFDTYVVNLNLIVALLDERLVALKAVRPGRDDEFRLVLRDYTGSLMYAVGKLAHMCEALSFEQSGHRTQFKDFKYHSDAYSEAVRQYSDIGQRLNVLWAALVAADRSNDPKGTAS